MADNSLALHDSKKRANPKAKCVAVVTKQECGPENFGTKLISLIDRYNRLLESAPAGHYEDLVSYVNLMAARKEPLFLLLKGEDIDVA